jgi:ribosome modulation factor
MTEPYTEAVEYTRPGIAKRLRRAQNRAYREGIAPRGEVTMGRILHDDNCPVMSNIPRCECKPEFWVGDFKLM